jgi:predicted phosphodiesterase
MYQESRKGKLLTKYTREALIAKLLEVADMLGRPPTRREIRCYGINDGPYYREFGSFEKAKVEAGLQQEEVSVIATCKSTDALLETLRANLSRQELKTIVAATGSTAVKPKLKHIPYETGYAKFLVLSDTHIGHSKFREDWWHHAIDRGVEEDCQFVLHIGDILEGMSNRPGHVYELDAIGFEAQFAKAKKLFGDCPLTIRGITGNHDGWYSGKADQGTDVGLRLAEALPNFEYLGADEADIEVENVRIKLWHGNDGSSYALSYRGQKIVESLDGGDKPHILITGHDHKSLFFLTRNVHVLGAGTLCEQTRFMRGKKLAAHRGYWIVEMWSNEHGLVRIRPEWVNFY